MYTDPKSRLKNEEFSFYKLIHYLHGKPFCQQCWKGCLQRIIKKLEDIFLRVMLSFQKAVLCNSKKLSQDDYYNHNQNLRTTLKKNWLRFESFSKQYKAQSHKLTFLEFIKIYYQWEHSEVDIKLDFVDVKLE